MGYSLFSIAVCGKSVAQIQSELGVRDTGQREKTAFSPFSAAMLPAGWYLIVSRFDFTDAKVLHRLSISCDVVTCTVEEHTMYSAASQWKNGSNTWSVEHDSSRGREHLACTGDFPDGFATIPERLFETQKSDTSTWSGHGTDHIFSIPVELAHELTGYRYDRSIVALDEKIDKPFEILEAIAQPAKERSFLQRLFGK